MGAPCYQARLRALEEEFGALRTKREAEAMNLSVLDWRIERLEVEIGQFALGGS